MTAEIKSVEWQSGCGALVKKLDLLNKIEGINDNINMAIIVEDSDASIIGVCEDKSVCIWQKRTGGNYWPSVHNFLPATGTCLSYNNESRILFIGLSNGTIMHYLVSEDLNKITHVRDYLAHMDRVTGIIHSGRHNWLLSCSRDKYFQWHCNLTGRRLGGHLSNASATCLQFDVESQCAFIADTIGQISIVKINGSTANLVSVFKGHASGIMSLAWDAHRNLLFSAGCDNIVLVWDIGGQKGATFELAGHQDVVQSLYFIDQKNILLSGSEDSYIIAWDMNAQRSSVVDWQESDKCQICSSPFFWNFKMMWECKSVGLRQHHCRKCGKAVCQKCSQNNSSLPAFGFELPVRLCNDCHNSLSTDDKKPLAVYHDVRQRVTHLHLSYREKLLLTVGRDKIIKIWDMSNEF